MKRRQFDIPQVFNDAEERKAKRTGRTLPLLLTLDFLPLAQRYVQEILIRAMHLELLPRSARGTGVTEKGLEYGHVARTFGGR